MPLAARANSPISSLSVRPFSPRLFRQEPSSNLQLPSAGWPGCTVCPEWNWIIKGEGLKHPKTLVFPIEKHKIPKSLTTCYSVVSKKALRFEGAARVFENSFLKLWEIWFLIEDLQHFTCWSSLFVWANGTAWSYKYLHIDDLYWFIIYQQYYQQYLYHLPIGWSPLRVNGLSYWYGWYTPLMIQHRW